jgi:hypothetical protein
MYWQMAAAVPATAAAPPVCSGCCCLQDFPYYFEDNVQHWLLWSTDKPLDKAAIEQHVAAKFPEQQWEHITFVNPAALQSVLAVSTLRSSSFMNTAVTKLQRTPCAALDCTAS